MRCFSYAGRIPPVPLSAYQRQLHLKHGTPAIDTFLQGIAERTSINASGALSQGFNQVLTAVGPEIEPKSVDLRKHLDPKQIHSLA
ncbi:MAG: hypothetical protein ACLP5H_33320, partial [Desulfomonilaceae bacterium]